MSAGNNKARACLREGKCGGPANTGQRAGDQNNWSSHFSSPRRSGSATENYQAVLPPSSRVQKQSRVFNEELRVLVVCAVIGVGVDDRLRIRDCLLQYQ